MIPAASQMTARIPPCTSESEMLAALYHSWCRDAHKCCCCTHTFNEHSDFQNITASDQPSLSVHSLADDSITLSDGLVIHQPAILLNGQALLWDAPLLDTDKAMPSGPGWEAWSDDTWRVFEVCTPRPGELLSMSSHTSTFNSGSLTRPYCTIQRSSSSEQGSECFRHLPL